MHFLKQAVGMMQAVTGANTDMENLSPRANTFLP